MMIHIAGSHVQIGDRLRQRCAWCGATLIDYELGRIMIPMDGPERPGPPATWAVGELIAVDGSVSYVVGHRDGDPLPEGACGKLDAEVTR